jgi:hypothetical protein
MFRKIIDTIFLLISLAFVFLGLYLYFVTGRLPFSIMMLTVIFFGMGAITQIISLIVKHEGWFVRKEDLTKKQSTLMLIFGIIFGICSLWVMLTFDLHVVLKTILFIGFLFFVIGGIFVLFKRERTRSLLRDTLGANNVNEPSADNE